MPSMVGPVVLEKTLVDVFVCFFVISCPWKRVWPLNWTNLNIVHRRMFCAEIDWTWLSGFREEDFNLDSVFLLFRNYLPLEKDVALHLICLYGIYRLTREFFTYMETITGEGVQFLTFARHSWSLSSEGSLACPTYSTVTRDTHTNCRAFSSGAVTTCFYDLSLSQLGFKHPTLRLWVQCSNLLFHRCGTLHLNKLQSPWSKMDKWVGRRQFKN